jgi:hypothetical protein
MRIRIQVIIMMQIHLDPDPQHCQDAQTGCGSETIFLTQLTYAKLPLLAAGELFRDSVRLVQEVDISEDGGHLILHVSLWHSLLNKIILKEQLDLIKMRLMSGGMEVTSSSTSASGIPCSTKSLKGKVRLD